MAPRRKVTLLDELFPVISTPTYLNQSIDEHDREKLKVNPLGFTRLAHEYDVPSGIPYDSVKGQYCLVLPAVYGDGHAKIFAMVEQLEFPRQELPKPVGPPDESPAF